MIVLIDDERDFKPDLVTDDFTVLRTSADALEWFKKLPEDTVIDQLWFDHDLGMVDGSADTTIPVLRWLEERFFFGDAPDIRKVIVHTSNRIGGDEIEKSMRRYIPTMRVFAGDYLTVS